jgi:AcrR family transcriptional regulator
MDAMSTIADGRRARGDESRRRVMERAVDLASLGGLEGLSIGALAADTDRSKGGVVALFGTKEQLQLATVEAAREIYIERVIAPALQVSGGRARLDALLDGWLDYSETRVFAGGCFFAAAAMELGPRPGPVRDAVALAMAEWHDTVRRVIQRAMDAGELARTTEAEQLAFEVTAILDGANSASRLTDSAAPYARARVALARLLG